MFDKFKFKEYINKGLENIGFSEPTEIQNIVITKALKNESIIGKSPTGTGKTHAFILPILQKLESNKTVQAVIIVPTRELGFQIYDEINKIIKFSTEYIDVKLFTGGTNRDQEISKLETTQPHIVIGTIGKLIDLTVNKNVLKIHNTNMIVIDEADMVFEMEELNEIDKLFSKFINPQVLLFSATFSKDLITFINKYLNKTEVIDLVGKTISKSSIEHVFIPTKNKSKDNLLLELLKCFNPYLALIFANTKIKVNEICDFLVLNNFKVAKITGELESRERKQILRRVKNGEFQYVVASDIAARGIDITGISHVINYELPDDIEYYIHRIGRTARYDLSGMAISFYDYEDDRYLERLRDKGLKCVYMKLDNGQLKLTKERNYKQKKTTIEEENVHKKYPVSKVVKPGYKKKRKEIINKEIRQIKRKKIDDIYKRKAKKNEDR